MVKAMPREAMFEKKKRIMLIDLLILNVDCVFGVGSTRVVHQAKTEKLT